MQRNGGFTLIELMIVVSIIGILATMALPAYQDRMIQAQVEEALGLAGVAQKAVGDYYARRGRLPASNEAAGLPPAGKFIGNFVDSVWVEQGAVHVRLGKRVNRYAAGKTLTLRPAFVAGERRVPVAWVCGLAQAPEGMKTGGENRTDLPAYHLPIDCRS